MTVSINPLPNMAPLRHSEMIFTLAAISILSALLIWWWLSGEHRRRGFELPLVMAGTALSALTIEPIFDNTLLYWYQPDSSLVILEGYGRAIPAFVPIGYAWFFGGIAYCSARYLDHGIARAMIWFLFAAAVCVDWLAISICQWTGLSAFYGPQPFVFVGSPLWFSFCDATGAFALGAAIHILHKQNLTVSRLWLLLLPTLSYGGVLGATSAPVSLALNSGWMPTLVWLAGATTIGLCLSIVYGITRLSGARRDGTAHSAVRTEDRFFEQRGRSGAI